MSGFAHAPTSWWRVIRATMMKNWRLSVTYPTWLINRMLGPIVWIAISVFSYTALLPETDLRDAFQAGAGSPDFVAFLVLGQTVFSLFSTLNFRGGMAIQRERWQGTLEAVMVAPTSRTAFLVGECLFGLIDGGWTVAVALIVTSIAFGAGYQMGDPLLAAVVIGLTLAAMVALSLFFAAFYVLTRSAGPLSFTIQTPIRFFTGTTFPVSALPAFLQPISLAIPMTWGMLATRAVFAGEASWASLAPNLAALALFTAFFWVVGVILVDRMEKIAKERGSLHTF